MSAGRTGFTTGTCAAAAAKAAALILAGGEAPGTVDVELPDGTKVALPTAYAETGEGWARASVKKDAGDDPDVTDGCLVVATVGWAAEGDVAFIAGEGVGTVTKPGLSVPPGEPAINPVPRRMIRQAVREVTDRPVAVTISIPGGRELAEKTFNPRLGVEGGLSILGTSGIVRPFSSSALRDALVCTLSVAVACKVKKPVFVPGRIGERAARKLFGLVPEQLIEVSNEWGFMIDEAAKIGFERMLVLGHPGKLAKLPAGDWDTHSSRSKSAVPSVTALVEETLGRSLPESPTVEGIFVGLADEERRLSADTLAARIARAVSSRARRRFPVSVVLVDMRGKILGTYGDLSSWQ